MGALEDWREAAAQARGVAPGGSALPWTVARLISIDEESNRARVSIHGSQPVDLPYLPNAYEGITTVFVQLDPLRSGGGQMVMGPCGVVPDPEVVLPPVPAPPSVTVTAEAVISPIWSGTWSGKYGKFDAWQASRTQYGGRSTLYQGNKYGSGALTGIAVYGDQVAGLGAIAITAMSVDVVIATSDTGTPSLQGTAQGTPSPGAPAPVGIVSSGVGRVVLDPLIAEGFRTGALKGLCLVGGTYLGVRGTSLGNGMVLRITYTRAA